MTSNSNTDFKTCWSLSGYKSSYNNSDRENMPLEEALMSGDYTNDARILNWSARPPVEVRNIGYIESVVLKLQKHLGSSYKM